MLSMRGRPITSTDVMNISEPDGNGTRQGVVFTPYGIATVLIDTLDGAEVIEACFILNGTLHSASFDSAEHGGTFTSAQIATLVTGMVTTVRTSEPRVTRSFRRISLTPPR